MGTDLLSQFLFAFEWSSGMAHPLWLDVVIGITLGIGLGLALESLRSDAP